MRISWDTTVPRFDHGVDQGVLYLTEGAIPWNGLRSVEERDDIRTVKNYFDGRAFRVTHNPGTFAATVDAFTYPPELDSYIGLEGPVTKQSRKTFGLSYQTGFGGFRQVHMVWNVTLKPRAVDRSTLAKVPSLENISFELETRPSRGPGVYVGTHLMVDLAEVRYPAAWDELEQTLYGTAWSDPRLPDIEEVVELFESYVIFRVTHHEDGTWTAEGPDDWITVHEDGTYEITSPTAYQVDDYVHTLSSY